MNPEQERQAQAKRDEHTVEELDKDLRFLNWQISQLEIMIRRALEQVNTINLLTVDTFQPFEEEEKTIDTSCSPFIKIAGKTDKMFCWLLAVLCSCVLGLGACEYISKNTKGDSTIPAIQSEQQAPSCKEKGKPCSQDSDCCSKDCAFNLACLGKCCFP